MRIINLRLLNFKPMPNLIIAILIIALTSCGYHLQGSGSILPPDIKTVAIPLVENDTTELDLSERMTEALRSSFERYGALKVVEDLGADAVLKVRVTDIDLKTRNVTSAQRDSVPDVAVDQDLVMTISAELRRHNGQLLYKNSNLSVSESFGGISSVVVTSSSSFAQGDISAGTLNSLGERASSREIARGQQAQVLDELIEETARKLYLEAVAADF